MQLPTVDYKADDAAAQFVESLRNTGFGVLKNHPIQQSLVESIYLNWQEFFNSHAKQEFAFDVEKQDGYFSSEISEVNYHYELHNRVLLKKALNLKIKR